MSKTSLNIRRYWINNQLLLLQSYSTFSLLKQNAPAVATDDPDDDPEKPVPVRSVLNKLKPSDRRYSLRREDEL